MDAIIEVDQLEKIEHFLEIGYYDSAVKESCTILEEILKRVYRQAISELPIDDRMILLDGEVKIGGGRKSYTHFGFGELTGLFNKTRLLDRWSKYTGSNMGIIRSVALDYIVELRNRLNHEWASMKKKVTKSEAQLVYDYLLNWLSFFGCEVVETVKDAEDTVPPAADKPVQEFKIGTYPHMKKKIVSGYDPSIKLERRRLKRQAAYSERHDAQSFAYAVERIGRREKLVGLDVGCADGYVTERRFKPEFGFEKVIGLDRNESLINKVQAEDHGMFHYRQIDLESRSFEDDMEDLMKEEGIREFDLIFCALTLHHLKNPVRLLIKLRKYLCKGGALIIRGVDDGGMMAYDDGGLVEEILGDCLCQASVSDRYHGRKFFPWLRSSGFSDIKMGYQLDDTTQMDSEERIDFFHYYFDFRQRYTATAVEREPDNPQFIEAHQRMLANLEKMEELFLRPDFYFTALTVSAIAIK